MEEKFYYKKRFVWGEIIDRILFLVIVSASLLYYLFTKTTPLWFKGSALLLVFISLFMVIKLLKARIAPAIMLTKERVVTRSVLFGKREVDFEKIISGTITDLGYRIDIAFRKLNDKTESFYLNLREIDNPEKLIEILKQRIKFE